ncbi:MAG: M20/M25/M40 family metallo-hydrolase [Kouleothrix sp.]
MALRQDALRAAAEFVLAAEALAHATDRLVATVGQLSVQPGASNVIPGAARLALDVRHHDDTVRTQAVAALHTRAEQIGAARRVSLSWQAVQASNAVQCDARLAGLLGQAIEAQGYPAQALPSGAGHDAVAIAAITPVAMLFVRCKGGISHHPDESVTTADVAVGLGALARFLRLLAHHG